MNDSTKNKVEINLSFKDFSITLRGVPLSVTTNNLVTPINSQDQDNNVSSPVYSLPNSSIASAPIVEQECDTSNLSSDPNVFFGYVSKEEVSPANRSNNPKAKYIKYGINGADPDIATESTWERAFGYSRGVLNHRARKELNKDNNVDPDEIVYASSRSPINCIYFTDRETHELISQNMVKD